MLRAYQCPFFSWEEDHCKLHCEGAVLKFTAPVAMDNYIDAFCADNPGWKNCTVAKNIMNAYETDS
jgi:hypothetical protein